MHQKHLLLSFVLLFFASLNSLGQALTIRGTVTDGSTGQPLISVSIGLKGTEKGTFTDMDGKYQIKVPDANAVLIFSMLGYEKLEKPVNNLTTVDVELKSSWMELNDVVIVGSRNLSRTRLETPVPIDVIDIRALQKNTAQTDISQLLTNTAPAFTSNRQSASDGTEHIDPAVLRGLGPDQTLVLINSKRRHTTSLVNNQSTLGNGSVGTDFSAIPMTAIDRIEILRDGASAQYGSDAIAGVVNLVLRKDRGFNANVAGGISDRNDGALTQLGLYYGFNVGQKGGFLSLTAEGLLRNKTNRTQNHDLIIFDQSALGNYFAYDFTENPDASRAYDDSVLVANDLTRDDFNFQVGDARIKNGAAFYNFTLPLNEKSLILYSFGGLNLRRGTGYGFRRLPSEYENNVPQIFPFGFQPELASKILDGSSALGLRWALGKWNFDLSNTFGTNKFDYTVNNSVNATMDTLSPTSFEAGGHQFSQNTTNFDVSKKYADILAGVNVALGGEYRIENYIISEGDPQSYARYEIAPDKTPGAQSFPGFSPNNVVDESRSNAAGYLDIEVDFTKSFMIGGAMRYENYSDFGNTFNYKAASRLNVTKWFSLRGSVSTGFRAPSLHQQFFNTVITDFVDGIPLQAGIFRNDSEVAKLLGIPKLTEEKSRNFGVGITLSPAKNFSISVDAYRVLVDDRIVLTGDLGYSPYGDPIPEVQAIFNNVGANSGRFFVNGVNTQTDGLDIVATYNVLLNESSKLDFSLAANLNKTQVVGGIQNIPTILNQQQETYFYETYFSSKERSLIETNAPRSKVNFTINYNVNKLSVMLRNIYWGEVTRDEFPFGTTQLHKGKVTTDLSLGYDIIKQLNLSVGVNNLLDKFPDQQVYENSYFGVFKYAPVQMGTMGRFYFARLTLKL